MSLVLPSSSLPNNNPYNMLNDGANTYWFYHKPSSLGLPSSLYESLVSNASNTIDIWDPYFHATIDHVIFSNIKDNVTIRILCTKSLNAFGTYMQEVIQNLQQLIPPTKNVNFGIGVIDTSTNSIWSFHDRYLIIDSNEVYLVGASVQYYHESKKTCGIYKMSNHNSITFIKNQFEAHWIASVKHPATIQFLHP